MKPEELLARLDQLRQDYEAVALVVAFRESSHFIFAGENDKSEKLAAVLEAGASPTAFLCVQRGEGRQLHVMVDPIPGLQDAPGIQEYCAAVADALTAEMSRDGIVRRPWVQ